jgi:hypothetical protein
MKTRQAKRASEVPNNERMRSVLGSCLSNQSKFRYVLLGSGYASRQNFVCIDKKGKHVIAALKDHWLVAPNEDNKKQRHFVLIDALSFETQKLCSAGLKPVAMKVHRYGSSLQISMAALAC